MLEKRTLPFFLTLSLGLLAAQLGWDPNVLQRGGPKTPAPYAPYKTIADDNCVPNEAYYLNKEAREKAEIDRIKRRMEKLSRWLKRDKGVDSQRTMEKVNELLSLDAELKWFDLESQSDVLIYRELCYE